MIGQHRQAPTHPHRVSARIRERPPVPLELRRPPGESKVARGPGEPGGPLSGARGMCSAPTPRPERPPSPMRPAAGGRTVGRPRHRRRTSAPPTAPPDLELLQAGRTAGGASGLALRRSVRGRAAEGVLAVEPCRPPTALPGFASAAPRSSAGRLCAAENDGHSRLARTTVSSRRAGVDDRRSSFVSIPLGRCSTCGRSSEQAGTERADARRVTAAERHQRAADDDRRAGTTLRTSVS